MSKKLKKIPHFDNEDQEREFWATHDSSEYVDLDKLVLAPPLPNLRKAKEPVLISLPKEITKRVKALAKKKLLSEEEVIESLVIAGIEAERRINGRHAR